MLCIYTDKNDNRTCAIMTCQNDQACKEYKHSIKIDINTRTKFYLYCNIFYTTALRSQKFNISNSSFQQKLIAGVDAGTKSIFTLGRGIKQRPK